MNDLKSLFPHEIEITEEHRELAKERGGLCFLGQVLLESFIPQKFHESIFWGLSIGNIGNVKLKTEIIVEGQLTSLYLDRNFDGKTVKFELRKNELSDNQG